MGGGGNLETFRNDKASQHFHVGYKRCNNFTLYTIELKFFDASFLTMMTTATSNSLSTGPPPHTELRIYTSASEIVI